jgi:hypothetical protein
MNARPNAASVDQRRHARHDINLPVTVATDDRRDTAWLCDLSSSGALIESSRVLPIGSTISFRCGTIAIAATVAWRKNGRIGLSFGDLVNSRSVMEQLDRSHAIACLAAHRPSVTFGKRTITVELP